MDELYFDSHEDYLAYCYERETSYARADYCPEEDEEYIKYCYKQYLMDIDDEELVE